MVYLVCVACWLLGGCYNTRANPVERFYCTLDSINEVVIGVVFADEGFNGYGLSGCSTFRFDELIHFNTFVDEVSESPSGRAELCGTESRFY